MTQFSLASFRKWINKRRKRLGRPYNKQWAESDADEIVGLDGGGPMPPTREQIASDDALTLVDEAEGVEVIENEEKIDPNSPLGRELKAQWDSVSTPTFASETKKSMEERYKQIGQKELTPEQIVELARQDRERLEAENKKKIAEGKSKPEGDVDRPKVIGGVGGLMDSLDD